MLPSIQERLDNVPARASAWGRRIGGASGDGKSGGLRVGRRVSRPARIVFQSGLIKEGR